MQENVAVRPQLIIDLTKNTGPLKYGASGFLYGLGNDGIPSVNMLVPLHPQVAAQKPEGGPQHPNGDAINVSDTFITAGGKEIEIYLQDIYPDWPYQFLGFDDYLAKVETIMRQVLASPNCNLFSYVPFNEPDQIWYNKSDKKESFFNDWKTVYRKIKSLNAHSRLVGPNFANYDSAFYRNFMTFARDNDCLPDVVSWHELNDDFFAGWYSRYDDYRSIESSLGITPREICINEYCRIKGDLGIPGQLVQWVVRFEASKVDACLAYWTSAGCLNDLVARDTDNQPTGGWWLYKWYGSLTGHTVRVTPPDANAEGLQGLASVDSEASQVRVLFGGSNGCADVVVKGLDFGESAHAVVWETASTGINPSHGPMVVMEGNYAVTQNRLIVGMDGMVDTSAYQMIVTPARDSLDGVNSHRYWAKYEAPSNNASSNFVVTAASNGYYQVRLGYFAGVKGFPETTQNMRIALNDSSLIDLPMPVAAGGENGASANIHLFLTAGINRLSFIPLLQSDGVAAPLEFIELTPARGEVARYEAEDALLGGTAEVIEDPAASGGKCVGSIGSGTENTLQFNHLLVPINGTYCMVVTFANGEFKGAHQYNNNVVDRFADISVNGGLPSRVFFRNTFAWNTYRTTLVKVELHAGENTVKFSNPLAAAPNIDRIEIALLCDSLVNDNGIPLSPTTQSD